MLEGIEINFNSNLETTLKILSIANNFSKSRDGHLYYSQPVGKYFKGSSVRNSVTLFICGFAPIRNIFRTLANICDKALSVATITHLFKVDLQKQKIKIRQNKNIITLI